MINKFENEYMESYWELQRFQWCNYFEGGNYDLSKVDSNIYDIVTRFNNKIQPYSRRSEVASLIISKDLVDKTSVVAELRNKIDNLYNYSDGISNLIHEDNEKYKLVLSNRMKDDVIRLINLRNSLSNDLGYNSYPELVLSSEEINKDKLLHLLNKFLEDNLIKAKHIIKKYNLNWENWFNDLDRIGTIEYKYDPIEIIDKLLKVLGFDEVRNKIEVNFSEEGYSGYAAQLSPDDIKIVVEPVKSINNLNTLFHELGHAISYALNKEDGIYKILSPSCDEAMAVVMEYIGPLLLLREEDKEKFYEITTLEYVRCAISALFEFDLWKSTDSAEELYIKHYSKLGIKIKNPSLWVLDTFRSIDPVYIHNYVVGAVLAEEIIKYLRKVCKDSYEEWGACLFQNIYRYGRKKCFREKIKIFEDLI